MNKFDQTTPQVQPQTPGYADRSFLHSWVAGAGLPLVISIITGFMAMLLTAAFIYVFDGSEYVKPMIAVGIFTTFTMWVLLLRRWMNLTALEKLTGLELDGIPNPEPAPEVVIRHDRITKDKAFRSNRYVFPVTDAQLARFFTLTLNGTKRISRREWTPKKTNGFSDQEYRDTFNKLVSYGLLEPVGDGYWYTEEGEEVARGYIDQTVPSPAPDPDAGENPGTHPTHPPTHPPKG